MPLRGIRVLVVDGDATARRLVSLILRHAGATVATATSADDAADCLARGWDPHVLITDLGLPDTDGFALVHQIRFCHAGIRVLVLTGDEPGLSERVAAAGAGLLRKPVNPDALVRSVARARPHPPVIPRTRPKESGRSD